jgi:RHS repeat-associated protein
VTPYQYTGQRWEDAIGLYFYQARWYDAARRRFIQPDSIVPEPGNPQDLNRYTYARNNPVKYNDPSGHFTPDMAFDIAFILFDIQQIQAEGWTFENTVALVVDLVCLGVPIGTGGGGGFRLAYAGGGEVAQTAIRATREVRAIQGTQKLIQASTGQVATQPPLPGFEDLVGKDLPPGIEAEEKVAKELGIPRAGQKTTLQAPYFTSKSGARQPDFDPALTPGKIVEVKDRERVSLEGNLYDFVEYARRNQLKVELWVRPDTLLSDEILRLWLGDNPLIDVRYIPQ